jgi:hypothetical protein
LLQVSCRWDFQYHCLCLAVFVVPRERDMASDDEWEEFEVEAERPEPISDDEWDSAEMSD